MQAEVTNYALAVALRDAETRQDADDIIDAENAIIARLGLPLDWTEQGLNAQANAAILAFIREAGVL